MTPTIDLSIIIPAYMEAERIADSLARLAEYLAANELGEVEVIVVTADSADGTAKIAQSAAGSFKHFRVLQAGPRVGKGRDVRLGMYEAAGRYKLFMDADLATPLQYLQNVKAFMDRGGQIAIAVRDLLVIHKGFLRKTASKSANVAAQLLVVPGIKDTQCGFKVFEASCAENIFGRMTMLQWSFDMEILAIARQLKYRIDFIDVPDWIDPKAANAGLGGDSILKVALEGFLDPFKIRYGIWTGRYRRPHYVHQARY
ncbi:MAG: glycosyltransferase family 2 protein [Candidatus Saccharimonadales bacterium]